MSSFQQEAQVFLPEGVNREARQECPTLVMESPTQLSEDSHSLFITDHLVGDVKEPEKIPQLCSTTAHRRRVAPPPSGFHLCDSGSNWDQMTTWFL